MNTLLTLIMNIPVDKPLNKKRMNTFYSIHSRVGYVSTLEKIKGIPR